MSRVSYMLTDATCCSVSLRKPIPLSSVYLVWYILLNGFGRLGVVKVALTLPVQRLYENEGML